VYNANVPVTHTYFVGRQQVLAHNADVCNRLIVEVMNKLGKGYDDVKAGLSEVLKQYKNIAANGDEARAIEYLAKLTGDKISNAQLTGMLNYIGTDAAKARQFAKDVQEYALLDDLAKDGRLLDNYVAVRSGNYSLYKQALDNIKPAFPKFYSFAAGVGKIYKNVVKTPLNSEYLGKMAINYRKTNSLWHDGNIVVFEYIDNSGNVQHLVQSTLANSGKHAERLAIEALEAQAIPLKNVKKVYSELELCSLESGGYGLGGCKKMIKEKIGVDIEVTYSYNYPGLGQDAAAKIIREASIEQRRLDFNQFK
jgi:hypothetical protein